MLTGIDWTINSRKGVASRADRKAILSKCCDIRNCLHFAATQLRISQHFDNIALKSALDATPFRELIVQSIPVNKIRVETERILWHQRLGHPCDEYLYSAHEFIDGVPKFKRRSDVLS